MRTIWKYEVSILDSDVEITLPTGARIVHVGNPQGLERAINFWAEVDLHSQPETRCFRIFGTGHLIEEDAWQYVGTAKTYGGALIWHLYERVR